MTTLEPAERPTPHAVGDAQTLLAENPRASAYATFFEQLDDEERAGLLALGTEHSFQKNAILIFQDEVDERVLLLLSGRVKVTRSEAEGREMLLAIRDAGDLLGELAFIDGLPRIATVAALEPVITLVLSGGAFRSYLERTPRVALVLLESVASRFRDSTRQRLQFAASDTLGRLSSRLVELADRYGEPDQDGLVVSMPITHDELASWAGASRAGVAQALQTLRDLGWLQTHRRRLVVRDLDALRARAA